MKIIRCTTIFLVIVIAFSGGCFSPPSTLTPTFENPPITASKNPVERYILVTPSLETRLSPTSAVWLPPAHILQFQPFEISTELPPDVKPQGKLVVWDNELHFSPQLRSNSIPGIAPDARVLSTSPDGKWLAYSQFSEESPTGKWLIVQSADGQQQKKIPMDLHWRSFGDYVWLDNQHLIFNNFINPPNVQRLLPNPAYPTVVVDPFTGEHIELPSDYPGLNLGMGGLRMRFDYSDVVYEPSLNLVIFPAWDGDEYIILWDRQANSVLAKIGVDNGLYPLWSPDALQFVIPLRKSAKIENTEWFSVKRDGQVEQLTQFGDYFQISEIGASNWSPDGQKLAFWIEIKPSLCPGLNLAVLDLETRQVTDTCVPGSSDYAPPPVWALDSRYLVVLNARTNPSQMILVDVEEGRAFDITNMTGDAKPIGWLVSSP